MTSIADLWRQGENSAVEFKSASARPESLAKEMVAFANTDGGSILLGVEDDGRVGGLSADFDYEEWAANIARNNVVPPLTVGISTQVLEGRPVLLIEVPKGRDKPYQTGNHQFLVRIGSTNRVATQQELMRLFQQAGVFRYDLTPVERTSMGSLDLGKIDAYFQRYDVDFEHDDDREGLLMNTDILTEQGVPTLAGLMVFGINPQRYLPDACISFAHFAGLEIAEALIDNYAIRGSRIRVFLFADRIEVVSPGRLPNTVTVEKLRRGVSYAVNPVLVKFMENLRFIDKLGRGLPMVWREAVSNDRSVVFEEVGEEFRVTLGLHAQAPGAAQTPR
jgi:ATP-dependent DNA helicase RecG